MMAAVISSETSVTIYQTTRHNIPEPFLCPQRPLIGTRHVPSTRNIRSSVSSCSIYYAIDEKVDSFLGIKCSPNIRVLNSGTVGLDRHVARMGEMRNSYKMLVG
jgi:hypothetical protein